MYKSEITNDEHVFAVTTTTGMNTELSINRLQQLENDEQIKTIAAIVGVDTKQVAESLKRIAEFFADAFKAYQKAFGLLLELQDFVERIDFDEIYSLQKEKRELHKLKFERPRIQHQVLERKPRHLIKKIIR